MLLTVKYSGKTVWVREGWEEHVGAYELKELSLATCSYICQLLAADNFVSSEFSCGQLQRVSLVPEKPGRS